MPSVATAFDVARLYDELRECVRANDQEGVKRVFAELVSARRPMSEILGEIRSLSKEREKPEPAEAPSLVREWPVRTSSTAAGQNAAAQMFRNLGTTIEPSPVPAASSAAGPAAAPQSESRHSLLDEQQHAQPPAESPPSVREPAGTPEPPITPSFMPEPSVSEEAAIQSPPQEEAAPRADEWPSHAASNTFQHSAPGPAFESLDPAGDPTSVAPPSSPTVPFEQAEIPVEQLPEPSAPPTFARTMSGPSDLRAEETAGWAPSVAAAASPQPEQFSPRLDYAPQPNASAALDHNAGDLAPVSSRAASLGVAFDPSRAPTEVERPARRMPVAGIVIAVVTTAAIAGGGWFMLSQRVGDQVAVNTAPPSAAAAAPVPDKAPARAAPAAQPPSVKAPVVTPPAATVRERTPADNAAPAPVTTPAAPPPPAPATPLHAAVPTLPDTPAAPRQPDAAAPTVAKLEPPKEATPSVAPAPDTPVAGAAPPAPKTAATAPSEPHASAAETAALLSRGDSLFSVGDVASARLFYEQAAEAGDGQAALRLGETYDPVFLERAKLRAIKGDRAAAAHWYRRARELGVAEAEILLKGIQTK
jgi:hypothetical protein